MDAGATEEASSVFAEDPGPHIVECVGVGEGHDLLADVFGGRLERAVVVLCPRHPGEQVLIAGFVDRIEDLLSIVEAVGTDDEALGFKLASERRGWGPL